MENISTRGGNQEKNGDLALRNSVVSAGWLWAVGGNKNAASVFVYRFFNQFRTVNIKPMKSSTFFWIYEEQYDKVTKLFSWRQIVLINWTRQHLELNHRRKKCINIRI